MSDLRVFTENVIAWGKDRGLHTNDLKPQFIKLTEELGEVAAGIARNAPDSIVDGIGDMLVVLINMGACFAKIFYPDDPEEQLRIEQYFLSLCAYQAWNEIKNRKGKTKNGVFVKEESNG